MCVCTQGCSPTRRAATNQPALPCLPSHLPPGRSGCDGSSVGHGVLAEDTAEVSCIDCTPDATCAPCDRCSDGEVVLFLSSPPPPCRTESTCVCVRWPPLALGFMVLRFPKTPCLLLPGFPPRIHDEPGILEPWGFCMMHLDAYRVGQIETAPCTPLSNRVCVKVGATVGGDGRIIPPPTYKGVFLPAHK